MADKGKNGKIAITWPDGLVGEYEQYMLIAVEVINPETPVMKFDKGWSLSIGPLEYNNVSVAVCAEMSKMIGAVLDRCTGKSTVSEVDLPSTAKKD